MVTAMLKESLYLLLIAPVALSLFSNLPGIDRFCSLKKETIQCDIHDNKYTETSFSYVDHKYIVRIVVNVLSTRYNKCPS
jgi:hypothetical protein